MSPPRERATVSTRPRVIGTDSSRYSADRVPSLDVTSSTRPDSATAAPAGSRDGRSTRWADHRVARREELVDATLRAIRRHGAGVGLDDIAATAGTSKTVIYRHFTDRAELYRAVAARVDETIMRGITEAVGASDLAAAQVDPREVLRLAVERYLELVEEEPEIYRFVVTAPLAPQAAHEAGASEAGRLMAAQIGGMVESALLAAGRPVTPAATWGHAVVGMVRAAADEWLREGGASSGTDRARLTEHLMTLVWSGLSPVWGAAGE